MTDTTEYEYEYALYFDTPYNINPEFLYGDPGTLKEIREVVAEVNLVAPELLRLLTIVRRPKGSTAYADYEFYTDTHEAQGAQV